MQDHSQMQSPPPPQSQWPLSQWSFWAAAIGAVALVLVLAQIAGPMLEPRPSAATQIGEIAGEIKRSAWRSFLGLKPEAVEPVPPSLWDRLALVAPALGVVAILLALVSALRGEPWRFALFGLGLGATAVLFQFLWWAALLIVGALLLIAILKAIGGIFPF